MQIQALAPQAISASDARRLVAQVHRDEPLAPHAGLRKVAVAAAAALTTVPRLEVVTASHSPVDGFEKLLLAAPDGARMEAVLIPLLVKGRHSACISSQVGCALACAFCATGRLGLTRNLETWEMVEQVRALRRRMVARGGGRLHGVVFQGMGEPLANVDRVLAAIEVMTNACALAVDARAITVCTSGLPQGIRRLAVGAPKVRLGLSMGSALPQVRAALMPISQAHPLDEVMDAVEEHTRRTGLSPMLAVTLLAGVNDQPEHAHALAALVRGFAQRSGRMPRLSLIPYNATAPAGHDRFSRSSSHDANRFRDLLSQAGIPTHLRYSGGGDIAAACGQLAAADTLANAGPSGAGQPGAGPG